MIGLEMTRAEQQVAREALDSFILTCDKLQHQAVRGIKRDEYAWKRYVAQELVHQLATR